MVPSPLSTKRPRSVVVVVAVVVLVVLVPPLTARTKFS